MKLREAVFCLALAIAFGTSPVSAQSLRNAIDTNPDPHIVEINLEANLARVEARNLIARALRTREIEMARVARNRTLLASAERVESMSLTAYREGASTLANVLEARRTAREVLGQYIDDLAAVWISTAQLRVLALQPLSARQP